MRFSKQTFRDAYNVFQNEFFKTPCIKYISKVQEKKFLKYINMFQKEFFNIGDDGNCGNGMIVAETAMVVKDA